MLKKRGKKMDAIDVLEKDLRFSTLFAGLRSSGMTKEFKKSQPYTLFAPTNAAFQKIPAEELELLFQNKEKMLNILNNHLIPEYLLFEDLKTKKTIKNFNCIDLFLSQILRSMMLILLKVILRQKMQ
jgi:uncharacterized surface protein with fasciclin (FAS1) repeats